MSIEAKAVAQYWGGDSHLAEWHALPEVYHNLVTEMKDQALRYRWRPEVSDKFVWGGNQIDDDWTNRFIELIRRNEGRPACYVMSMGSNNVRRSTDYRRHIKVLELTHRIIQTVETTRCATLCVISPIPDGEGKSDARIEALNVDLEKLCRVRIDYNLNFAFKDWGLKSGEREDQVRAVHETRLAAPQQS